MRELVNAMGFQALHCLHDVLDHVGLADPGTIPPTASDVVRSEVWVHVWLDWKCNMAACTLQLATLH